MPPQPLIDFKKIDVEKTLYDLDEIKKEVPHRYEMLQIDRIIHFDREEGVIVGVKEVREDEFWVKGHIPGRPILPGMLLLEASAQLSFFHFRKAGDAPPGTFFGFARVEGVRFRGIAVPGDMIVIAVKLMQTRRNTATYAAQAFVDGKFVFEAEMMGAAV